MKHGPRLKRILLIDDDPVTHLIVKRMVAYLQLPWDLRIYTHPAKTLWALSEDVWSPDFAIIDHHLPDLKGPDLVELLHQQGHHFPWAWISSSLIKPEIHAASAPEAYFAKPIEADTLRMCDTLARLAIAAKESPQD